MILFQLSHMLCAVTSVADVTASPAKALRCYVIQQRAAPEVTSSPGAVVTSILRSTHNAMLRESSPVKYLRTTAKMLQQYLK